MIHPNTELRFINQEIGYGVFATAFIPVGTVVYTRDSMEAVISPVKYAQLMEPLKSTVEKYSYIDENGDRIVSWDHGKFVNHCCDCNTISTGYGFEIAIKDIKIGEEITDEYGLFNLEYEMDLQCNKPGCRLKVKAADLMTYYDKWDASIKKALKRFVLVDQPLLPLMEPDTLNAIESFYRDNNCYTSVKMLKRQHLVPTLFSENGATNKIP